MTDTTIENTNEAPTLEQLQATIATLEGEKAAILANKNEILGKHTKVVTDAKTLRDERDKAVRDAAIASGNVEAVEATIRGQLQAEIDAATTRATDLEKNLHSLVVDREIQSALTANGFAPHFHSMLLKSAKTEQVTVDGIVAKINGQPVADYWSAFAKSDEGKHFIAAPLNSGSGVADRSSGASETEFTATNFNTTEFFKVFDRNPTAARAIAARCDKSHLLEGL